MARKKISEDVILSTFTFAHLKVQLLGFTNEFGEKRYKIKRYLGNDLDVDIYEYFDSAYTAYRMRINYFLDRFLIDHYTTVL